MPNMQIIISDPNMTHYQTGIPSGDKYKITLRDIFLDTNITVDSAIILQSNLLYNKLGNIKEIILPIYIHAKDAGSYYYRTHREFILDTTQTTLIDIAVLQNLSGTVFDYINTLSLNFDVEKIE